MKVKFFYIIKRNGELWTSSFCEVINAKKYDDNYSAYLAEAVWEMRCVEDVDYELEEIKKVEKGEIECFKTGTDIFSTIVYKDRVEFEYNWEDEDWPDWSCSLEEYKRILLGKKAFLMLPKEIESYLEIKINDIEK